MQKNIIISLLILLASCKSKNENEPTAKAENWDLVERIRYDYKLNSTGRPDTTFVYTYHSNEGIVTDSTINFNTNKYNNNNFVTEIRYFKIEPNNKVVAQFIVKYLFGKTGMLQSATVFNGDVVVKDDKYIYSDSNLLSKHIAIRSKNLSLPGESDIELQDNIPFSNNTALDTMVRVVKYDSTNKVVETTLTDNRGNILRSDVNIYTGTTPFATYSTNVKGDTVQKIRYKVEGPTLHTMIETDSLILLQTTRNGKKIGQITQFKNTNQKWRRAIRYDSKGKITEEKLYKTI